MAKNTPVDDEILEDEFEVEDEDEGSENANADPDNLLEQEVDLSAVEVPKPIPRNWYTLTIVSATPGMSKGDQNKGTGPQPKISIRTKVEGGQYDGRTIFDDMSFAPGALPFTKQALVALGKIGRAHV